ncbi:4Fe-4S binding protein [uncultured Phascolarctobacterium sp.]|jgi:MinD superfamily P-loop ATPase|uniref:nucleotide-binding protein n=1 Tax=uncultured Phascolarctobacterium sp. TaxID=512296 RepID=UPI0015A7ACDC|nr:4Fe-4S binding protein [uncultured Phascolarctobacterium sp.]
MRIAVLSGKGGTGKTFVATNLAAAAQNAAYIDCDVEEPNGRLFLKPTNCIEQQVFTRLPEFDAEKCDGCRKCVDFCQFNALIFVKNKPMVFSEICHDCGGCVRVCPQKAVTEKERPVGIVQTGSCQSIDVVTGVLNPGEVSAVPVIKTTLKEGFAKGLISVIDCPPGSGCSVMESVTASNCCVLVAEPTAFGFHNFRMVYKLVKLFDKPCFVVINKEDTPYEPLEEFCVQNKVPVLLRIPYSSELAKLGAEGKLAYEQDQRCTAWFDRLLEVIQQEVTV